MFGDSLSKAQGDQAKAAAEEARALVASAGGACFKAVPPWITEQQTVLRDHIARGPRYMCPHTVNPTAVFAAVWAPGVVVCARCSDKLAVSAVMEFPRAAVT